MGMFKTLIHLFVASFSLLALSSGAFAKDPPFDLPAREDLLKLRSALVSTSRGDLYFELFPEDAPWHVANFKYLADKGFYQGLRFHFFYEGYILQAGAPTNDPDSGPGYSLPAEFNSRKHRFGSLGMARVKDGSNPERQSHGSQFHLLLKDAPHMDGRYTVFGQLVSGENVLRQLKQWDRIRDIKVFIRE